MHPGQGAGGREFNAKVPVRDRVHGVLGHLRAAPCIDKSQLARDKLAVDRQRGAGDGAGTKRAPIGVGGHFQQAEPIASQHFDPGQEMVRKPHRLGPLQMRIARNDDILMDFRHREQRRLRPEEFLPQDGAGVLEE